MKTTISKCASVLINGKEFQFQDVDDVQIDTSKTRDYGSTLLVLNIENLSIDDLRFLRGAVSDELVRRARNGTMS